MTHAEAFALGLYVVTPATLVAGVLLGMTVNSLLHPRTRFLAWREVGVACSVTYPLLIAAFALLMATAGALDRPGIVF